MGLIVLAAPSQANLYAITSRNVRLVKLETVLEKGYIPRQMCETFATP
jgi:hypothetical protein